MKVWFPKFFTEAHRKPEQGEALAAELERVGIHCVLEASRDCDLMFCGSMWLSRDSCPTAYRLRIPVVHYNWDMYPWQMQGTARECLQPKAWHIYAHELKSCYDILVPSACTVVRTRQFTKRSATVIKSAVHLWEGEPFDGGWVVDVMRRYPDPNYHAVKLACDELGIPCIETGAELPWEEYQRAILGARLLVSSYREASTGGLSLLEGYALGKPALLSNSPFQGAGDYFGDRASYFQWDDRADLKAKIGQLYSQACTPPSDCREWVQAEYSDAAFASRLAKRFRELKPC